MNYALMALLLCTFGLRADDSPPDTSDVAMVAPVAPRTQPGTLKPVKLETSLIATDPYAPPTPDDRAEWVIRRTFGWRSFAAGAISAGRKTWWNTPEEWGGQWSGFGKRFATRQADVMMASSMEASLGAIWGEDPRYFRSGQEGFRKRLKHAVTSAFLTYRQDGSRDVAWARFIAIPSSRAITYSWRPDSEKHWWKMAAQPLGTGIGGKMFSNLMREFLPDITRKLRHKRKDGQEPPATSPRQ